MKRAERTERPLAAVTGTVISERYRLIGTPEVGQVATVSRAEQIESGRAVVVKIFHEVGRNDWRLIELFRHPTARGAGRLDLPSAFVAVYECALTDDGRLFLVTELVEGPSVSDLLRQTPPLTLLRTLELAMRVGEAVEALLNLGFLDLRLAPHEIAIVKDDRVKLRRSDVPILWRLGLADQLAAAEASGRDSRYTPPEEVPGLPVTEAGVVYQFGLLLYEFLCGRLPFEGSTPAQIRGRQLGPLRTQLRNRHHALPASVNRLVSRMLHPDPRTRPVSLTFVLNELWSALGHVQAKMAATFIGSSVPSAAAISPARRSWTRRWALVGLATLVAGGVLLTWPDVVNVPRIPVRSTVDMARRATPAPINPPLRDTADQDASTVESGLDPSADSPAPAATPLPHVPLPPSGGTPAPAGSTPSTLSSLAKREGAAMTAEPKVGAPAVSPIAEPPRTPPIGKGPAARRAPLRPETETGSAKIAPTPSPQPESPVPPPPGRSIQPPPDNPRAADPGAIVEWIARESPRQWRNGGLLQGVLADIAANPPTNRADAPHPRPSEPSEGTQPWR